MSWNIDCPECGCAGNQILENTIGEYECPDCGLIQAQAIDMGKDYRVFADGKERKKPKSQRKKNLDSKC